MQKGENFANHGDPNYSQWKDVAYFEVNNNPKNQNHHVTHMGLTIENDGCTPIFDEHSNIIAELLQGNWPLFSDVVGVC